MFACGTTLLCPASSAIGPADPFFNFVTMLLHFDGADGSQAFVDVKGNSFTMTGNPHLRTAQAKFGTSSLYYDGVAGTALTLPNSALCNFPGDFTVEGYFYPTTGTPGGTIIDLGGVANLNWQPLHVNLDGNGHIQLCASSANSGLDIANFANFGVVTVNAWNHFAVCKTPAGYQCFLKGALGLTVNNSAQPFVPAYGIALGNYPVDSQNNFPSAGAMPSIYMDEFRITNGVARYTSNFTPPAAPFPNF